MPVVVPKESVPSLVTLNSNIQTKDALQSSSVSLRHLELYLWAACLFGKKMASKWFSLQPFYACSAFVSATTRMMRWSPGRLTQWSTLLKICSQSTVVTSALSYLAARLTSLKVMSGLLTFGLRWLTWWRRGSLATVRSLLQAQIHLPLPTSSVSSHASVSFLRTQQWPFHNPCSPK